MMTDSSLDTQILDPLLKVSGMKPEDAKVFKEALLKVIFSEAVLKIIESLPEEKKKEALKALAEKQLEKDKLAAFQKILQDSPATKQVLEEYLKNDLPKFIEELAVTFAQNTTPEKRDEFLKLLAHA